MVAITRAWQSGLLALSTSYLHQLLSENTHLQVRPLGQAVTGYTRAEPRFLRVANGPYSID